MKNISRRVFIKGLAVAGVAAAASTVLAGCNTNMIPGVGDGAEDDTVEEVPTTNQSQTYTVPDTDGKEYLTLTATGLTVLKEAEVAAISFKVENKTGAVVKFNDTRASNVLMVIEDETEVEFDGNSATKGTINEDLGVNNNMSGDELAEGVTNKCLYINLNPNLGNDWSTMKVTIPVTLTGAAATKDNVVKNMEFTFENK